jgi:hypothetical protein
MRLDLRAFTEIFELEVLPGSEGSDAAGDSERGSEIQSSERESSQALLMVSQVMMVARVEHSRSRVHGECFVFVEFGAFPTRWIRANGGGELDRG